MKKNIKKYIEVVENVLSNKLCDQILDEFSDKSEWENAKVISSYEPEENIKNEYRSCKQIRLSNETIQKNSLIRKEIDDNLFSSMGKVFKVLQSKYRYLHIQSDTGYELLKYDVGDFFKQHTDSCMQQPKTISCSLFLNEDYKGGELAFFDRKLKYKPKKGSAIIFPSNFMFPHEIMPVTKGTRYSIVSWFI